MRRARLLGAAGACLSVVLLAGCNGGNGDDEPQALPTTTASSPSESDSPTEALSPTEATDDGSSPSKADLDAFVAQGRQALKSMMSDSMRQTYSSIKIKPDYPSGITYVYVFRKAVDPGTAKSQLDKSASILEETFKKSVGPALESQGFAEPTVTWTYQNPDGTVVWSKTFS